MNEVVIKAVMHAVRAEWTAFASQGVKAVGPVAEIERSPSALRRQMQVIDATYAGAVIVDVFRRHPWLQSFTLEFRPSAEYDDQGGSYRSISSSATAVTCVPGEQLPSEVAGSDGSMDEQRAEDAVSEEFWDCDADVLSVFQHEDDYSGLCARTAENFRGALKR